ncbi:YitT family protein [Sediminispirochaeta bajacaliforniensis]|uniref:YitT family protein n=1 Tax=Sediminispirochaeta bajacaliforniensis TaxID=148 RepID=UPI00036CAC5A|nr:YitT family protein [Sediminispirochaeta bajacaliforniensis]
MSEGVMRKHSFFSLFRQLCGIFAGSLVYGIGLSWFLVPFKIVPGGVGGLSQILYHMFGWSMGISMIIMNFPLWIMGIVFVGRQFGLGTFVGFFVSALMTDLVAPKRLYCWNLMRDLIEKYNTKNGVLTDPLDWALTDDVFVAAIAGSILMGIGIGLIFKSRASTGGTDIPVALMKKKFNISIGNGYLIIESVIILFTGFVFRDINIIIWSYFALFLSSRFADIMTEGFSRVKAAYIISMDDGAVERIKERIYEEMDRGVTFLRGMGSYSRKGIKVIYVTFHMRQTAVLKRIALEEDPKVFMVMHDVHDVVGYGFKTRSLEM